MSDMAYIKVYKDWREATKRLKDAEKGRLIDAMVAYANGEDPEPILSGNEQYSFDGFRAQIDRDRAELERKSELRSKAGALGNVVRWGDRKPSQCDNSDRNASQKSQCDKLDRKHRKEEKTKDKDQDKDEEEKTKDEEVYTPPHGGVQRGARFTPPGVDQVREYCAEIGSVVDPEEFVNFYASKGWKVGKDSPMKDWKASVRYWEAQRRKTDNPTDKPSKWGQIGQMV